MLEYIENAGTQYIDTGYRPDPNNPIPYRPYVLPILGARLYDGEKLINDYKPCKNPDGIAGVYDVITDTFLTADEFLQMMCEHYARADSISVKNHLGCEIEYIRKSEGE